jgi:hypothetical protein
MRHLHSRDNYLKNINERKIIQQDKMLEDLTTKLILEENAPGSGAFGNNVKWGDSLLGRFINFVIRKIGVGVDMGRISLVSKQMKSQFERLVSESAIRTLSKEDQEDISKVQISSILGVLKKAVDDGEKVGKLKDITQSTIDNLEDLEVSEKSEESKKVIIAALEEFLKFLEKYKDSDGKGGPLSEDADKTEDDDEKESEEGKPGDKISIKTGYPTMIKNLKSLSLVLANYKKFKSNAITSAPEDYIYITKGGETIEAIQKDVKINKNKLAIEQIWSANAKTLEPYTIKADKSKMDKNKLQLGKDIKIKLALVKESFIFEEGPIQTSMVGDKSGIGAGGSKDRNVGTGKEDHLTQAYTKLKKACEILENPKDKGIGVTFDFLKAITDKSVDEESKVAIKSLYKEILRYLIGDKKATLNAPADSLFVESVDTIKDKNKKIIVAEKIARFTMRAIQFDGQNLYAGLGDLGKPLQQFVDSMKELKKIDPEELKEVVKKQESKLLKYDSYLTLIREAEGDEAQAQGENKEDKSAEISKEIKEYFDENLDFDAFLLSEEEIKVVEEKVEDASKEQGKSIIINGMNPIIEIVRLFNRAYKLHTTDVIPGARTDGAVDRLTYNEYTTFGSSSGAPSATEHGPYRHKKTFNIWEDAVFDILADTRFSPVFAKETVLDDGGGNVREGAGVALRQLMTDLLDGDNLYKSSGGGDSAGAQKKAIEKYFGETATTFFETNSDVQLGMVDKKTGKNDIEINNETADAITVSNLQFTKSSSLTSDEVLKESKFRFTTLQVNGKNSEGKIVHWYLFVNEMANDKYYVMMSKTMAWFRNLIQSEYPSTEIGKGDSDVAPEMRDRLGSGPYPIIHTVMTKKTLESIATNRAKSIEIKGLVKEEDKPKTITENITITNVNWLSLKKMEDNKVKGLNILKLESKDNVANSLKSIKPTFINYREVVDKKYDEGKFTPGVISK